MSTGFLGENWGFWLITIIPRADPDTFRKIADLDQHFTALLGDAKRYFMFLPFRGEVYELEPKGQALHVSLTICHEERGEGRGNRALLRRSDRGGMAEPEGRERR